MADRRIRAGESVVAEYVGECVVIQHHEKNHKRTYTWNPTLGRMTVTVRGLTYEIPPPPVDAV